MLLHLHRASNKIRRNPKPTTLALPIPTASAIVAQMAPKGLQLVRDAVNPFHEAVPLRFLRRLWRRQIDDVVQVGDGPWVEAKTKKTNINPTKCAFN